MRKLSLDLNSLIGMMQIDHAWDTTGCLDLETGDIYMLGSDMLNIDPDDAEAVNRVSPFLQPLIPIAAAARAGHERFQLVPGVPRTEKLVDMAKFAGELPDSPLRDALKNALREGDSDDAFYVALRGNESESERWAEFYQAQSERRAREWLATLGIEPVHAAFDESSLYEEDPQESANSQENDE